MYLQGHNKDGRNCTLVSIANLTGKDYNMVREIAIKYGAYIPEKGGTFTSKVPFILNELGIACTLKHPRRGADKLTGLVHFFESNKKIGHTAMMIQGKILDTNGKWSFLKQFRQASKFHVKAVHVISNYDVDWSIIPDKFRHHFYIPNTQKPTCNMCLSNSHVESDCPLISVWKG